MNQFNWLAEFLLLGLLMVIPLFLILDLVDQNATAQILAKDVLAGIIVLVLAYAYVLGIVMHVVARRAFNKRENKAKLKLLKEYREKLGTKLFLRLAECDVEDLTVKSESVPEAFRTMRRFLASKFSISLSELSQPRAVLRATRGAIIPLAFLGMVAAFWGFQKQSNLGYAISALSFVASGLSFWAFGNRSRDFERHCLTFLLVNRPLAEKTLCDEWPVEDDEGTSGDRPSTAEEQE